MKNFYDILGTPADCTELEIREAYEKLSQKFHPNLNPDDTYYLNRYQNVCEAYTILGNPAKRSKYDKSLKAAGQYHTRTGRGRRFSGTTVVNVLFSLVLVVITAIFGSYVFKALNGSGPKALASAAAVSGLPVAKATVKHVKQKRQRHQAKVKQFNHFPYTRHRADTVLSQVNPILPAKTTSQIVSKPQPAMPAQPIEKPDYLYTSYLKANETGIINMRDDKYYNAQVVATIPGNTKVWVMEEDGRYYKVRYGQITGYVPAWTVVR